MTTTETLMVVSMLETPRVGHVFEKVPTHVTFFPPFDLDTDLLDEFDGDMRELIEQTTQPTVVVGDRGFDDEPDAPVTRLNRISPTFNAITGFDIHAGIWRSVYSLGGVVDPTYAGLQWKPHISDTPDVQLREGQEILLTNLTVIERDSQRRKLVRAIYEWGKRP